MGDCTGKADRDAALNALDRAKPPLLPPMVVVTRPQDWAEPARSWLFTEEAIARAAERAKGRRA